MFCTKCQADKESTEFYKDKTRKNGYEPYCKDCKNSMNKDWYKNNIERKAQYGKEWAENNKDKKQKSREKWRAKAGAETINCECGGHNTKLSKTNHMKTKRHATYVNPQE